MRLVNNNLYLAWHEYLLLFLLLKLIETCLDDYLVNL